MSRQPAVRGGLLWRLLLVGAAWMSPLAGASEADVFDLQIRPLKPDLYVLERPDPLRQPVEPNALVIVNEADVVVVDAGGVPRSAENAIRLIRGITGAPMQYIGRQERQFTDFIAQLEKLVAQGTAAPRQRQLLADVRLARDENRKVTLTPPTLSFTDELILHRGTREIHIRHLGRGNTEGDAIVWLPRERVLASGDLVVLPIPYGFGSFPKQWIETLEKLAAYDFELLVPGHGAVQTDREHIRLVQAMLASVREQAAAAVARGLDLEATRSAIDLSPWEHQIAGDDPERKRLFKAWWTDPITRSAWLEAQDLPIVQGAADETG